MQLLELTEPGGHLQSQALEHQTPVGSAFVVMKKVHLLA